MKIIKGGISREIEQRQLQEYLRKGFAVENIPAEPAPLPATPKKKPAKTV